MQSVKNFLLECIENKKKITVDFLLSCGNTQTFHKKNKIKWWACRGNEHGILRLNWEAFECIKGGKLHLTKLHLKNYPIAPIGYKWWMKMYNELGIQKANIFYPENVKDGETIIVIYDGVFIQEKINWIHGKIKLFERVKEIFVYENLLFKLPIILSLLEKDKESKKDNTWGLMR